VQDPTDAFDRVRGGWAIRCAWGAVGQLFTDSRQINKILHSFNLEFNIKEYQSAWRSLVVFCTWANIPVDLTSLVWTRNQGCRSPRFSAAFHCLLAALACLERLTFICVLLRRRVPGLSPGEDRRGQLVALGAFFVPFDEERGLGRVSVTLCHGS
jgi:hypothetical protein